LPYLKDYSSDRNLDFRIEVSPMAKRLCHKGIPTVK
jgi:hypothetical protein